MSKDGLGSSAASDPAYEVLGTEFSYRADVEDVSLREVSTLQLDAARPSSRARTRAARENVGGAGSVRAGVRCAFDAEGRLVEKREAEGVVWRYEWNVAGRLVRAQRDADPDITFGYDALGRRVWKRYRGQTTHWLWDRGQLLHEWVEGTLLPRTACSEAELALEAWLARDDGARGTREAPVTWLFEPGGLAPLARLSGDACRTFVADDAGEPVLMTSAPPGADAATATAVTLDRFLCPFRAGGRYEDAETGLQLDGLRYFDPKARRYLSREPRAYMRPIVEANRDPIWDTTETSGLRAPTACLVGPRVIV
jgi:YD repeat-containing protein